MSLPLIHSMQKSSPMEKAQIRGIFEARNGSDGLLPETKAFVLNHLDRKTASLAYTRGILEDLEVQLMGDLASVERISDTANPLLRSLLGKLKI